MSYLIDSYIHSRYELNDYYEIGDMFEAKTVSQYTVDTTCWCCIECDELFPENVEHEILADHIAEAHSELMPRKEHYALQ